MKHNYSIDPESNSANLFYEWLLSETVTSLKNSYGNIESLKSTLFLFANRAYESHMPENKIAEILGISIVHAGYSEAEESGVYEIFESYIEVAKGTHGYT